MAGSNGNFTRNNHVARGDWYYARKFSPMLPEGNLWTGANRGLPFPMSLPTGATIGRVAVTAPKLYDVTPSATPLYSVSVSASKLYDVSVSAAA